MLVEKKFNSLEDAKKIYPQLAADNNRKYVFGIDDKIYNYYGKITEKQSLCWRISRLFQFILASFILPLGCCIESYRDFLSRKFNEIKHPIKTVECFILKEPEIAPKQAQIVQPEEKMIQDMFALLKDPPQLPVPINIPKHIVIENPKNPEFPDEFAPFKEPPQLPAPKNPPQPEVIEKPKEAPDINPPVEIKPILEPKPAPKQETLDKRYKQINRLMNSINPNKPEVNEKIEKTVTEFFQALSDEEFQELVPKFLKDRYQELWAKIKGGIKFCQAYEQVRIKTLEVILDRVVKNPKSMGIQSISQLLYLASYNNMKSFISEIPLEMINDLVKNYSKSFSEEMVKENKINSSHLFHFCETIEDVQQKQLVINEIVQALEPDEILLILDQIKDPIDNYKEMCIVMLSALQNVQEQAVQIKLNTIIQDVRDQYEKKHIVYLTYDGIMNEIFAKSESFEQFYHIIRYVTENGIPYGAIALKAIYEKNWINALINKNDYGFINKCLEHCFDPKIYLALKNEMIKEENKMDQYHADFFGRVRERLDIVNEKGFMRPIEINLNTSVTSHDGHPIGVTIYKTLRKRTGFQIYELRTDDDVKLGEISLKSTKYGLFIPHFQLEAFQKVNGKVAYNNIVQALHEFAVRQSFEMGLQGHVAIDATANLTSLHFLSGYHYQDNLAFTCYLIADELKDLIIEYFDVPNGKRPLKEILEQIEQLEKNLEANYRKNNSEMNMAISFNMIRKKARKVLGADPVDIKEVLENGVYFDKNSYMKKVLANYPLHHKKLGPLLVELEHAVDHYEDTDQILKKIEDLKNEGDEQIQKILEKGKKLANKHQKNPDLENIAYYLARYKPKSFGGRMYLPDESIEKWKNIIEQKK